MAIGKKPLSSLSPIIFLKDGHVKLSIGGTGGKEVISSMVQVCVLIFNKDIIDLVLLQVIYNLFVAELKPFEAVRQPRVFTTLVPNEIRYENLTMGQTSFTVNSDVIDHLIKMVIQHYFI